MKELTTRELEKLLKKRDLNPDTSWFYTQFRGKFELEYAMESISLADAAKNLVKFLDKKKINEVLFFPEPSFDCDIISAMVEKKELAAFLKKNIDTDTNAHVADKEMTWIFTITHEDDFFISGDPELVKEFLTFFKNAKCSSFEQIQSDWQKRKYKKSKT